jgi:hypothetical protein
MSTSEVCPEGTGATMAARPLSGPPMLQAPSAEFAPRWRFKSAPAAQGIRSDVLVIRHAERWYPFPWLQ